MQGHREGCMCVICKQARRSGRQWGGMTDACWLPAAALPGARKEGPAPRCGKRAYVRAVAQRPGGTSCTEVRMLGVTRTARKSDFPADTLRYRLHDGRQAS